MIDIHLTTVSDHRGRKMGMYPHLILEESTSRPSCREGGVD